jgi:L-2-hydroxyglutarate oxidase
MSVFDYIIIGGGIIGISSAMHLAKKFPAARILIIEKESKPAKHQTGRNSGVIHSGIYYKPGSLKAKFCLAGSSSLIKFCNDNDIEYRTCGKLIVATNKEQIDSLHVLYERGLQNNLDIKLINQEEALEFEPYVNCLKAIHVKSTAITDYKIVTRKFLDVFEKSGGAIKFNTRVIDIIKYNDKIILVTDKNEFECKFLINCTGLYSDRIARLSGDDPKSMIIPFRGEYYKLKNDKSYLVKSLIYPVPNPKYPFLGVHLTSMINGEIHAGPNAVFAFSREGYRKLDINVRDLFDSVRYKGFIKLAYKNFHEGMVEFHRSLNKKAFLKSLQELVPAINSEDLIKCDSGVRAQAVDKDGNLVDDFVISKNQNILNICNAPSPAATSSLEIGREVASKIPSVGIKKIIQS